MDEREFHKQFRNMGNITEEVNARKVIKALSHTSELTDEQFDFLQDKINTTIKRRRKKITGRKKRKSKK